MIVDREPHNGVYIFIEITSYVVSFILYCLGWNVMSAIILVLSGLGLFLVLAITTRSFLNSRGLFLLVSNGSIGLACFRLHSFQTPWEIGTWLCFLIAAASVLLGYEFGIVKKPRWGKISAIKFNRIIVFIGLCGVIVFVFLVEVYFFHGIPLLSSDMNSYVSFGLPYLHYVTVTSATVPALAVVLFDNKNTTKTIKRMVMLCTLLCAAIPFALVSRQLILQMIITFAISYFNVHGLRRIKLRYVLMIGIVLLAAWFFATGKRNQNNEYLASVFYLDSPKNARLYQIYLYIAYNYDAFNENLKTAAFSTLGYRSLNPLWTLIGVKGLWPDEIVGFDHLKRMAVFNTTPMVFTPYCDFGVPGIFVYCFCIGFYTQRVEHRANFCADRSYIVKKAIVDYCLIMSFFTSFFSNTMIWVQLIIVSLFSLVTDISDRKKLCNMLK